MGGRGNQLVKFAVKSLKQRHAPDPPRLSQHDGRMTLLIACTGMAKPTALVKRTSWAALGLYTRRRAWLGKYRPPCCLASRHALQSQGALHGTWQSSASPLYLPSQVAIHTFPFLLTDQLLSHCFFKKNFYYEVGKGIMNLHVHIRPTSTITDPRPPICRPHPFPPPHPGTGLFWSKPVFL